MSSPDTPAAPDLESVGARRLRWNRLLSFGLVGATTTASWHFLVIYGYPLWVIIPVMAAQSSLGYLGMSFFVGTWFGFFAALRGPEGDPHHPAHRARDLDPDTRIAILMPVYHEDPRRVGAGLGAMWEDLRRYPEATRFDIFLLSDSRKLDSCVQEEWIAHVLSDAYPDARVVYRHRASNAAAKIGNIADFLRRWGAGYRYLLMLDADSIVPAESVMRMARIMEGNPRIGLIQAFPSMVIRSTLYARISRFASAISLKVGLYGQLFFYPGKGFYYGHNAIIRTDAFMAHCGLPILRRKGPWMAGKPLSHDFVEAALLEGAGYEVWTLPDIDSFEELPTNMIDDMQREVRWMYGSLVWLRIFLTSRITPLYQARLFTSTINYLNPLFGWIFFAMTLFGVRYVFEHPLRAHAIMRQYALLFAFSFAFLIFSILTRLLLPILYLWKTRTARLYGGVVKLLWSHLLLFFYGLAIGPIFMTQYTRMLWHWIKGEKMHWGEQNRADRGVSWEEAFRHFWWVSATGIGLAWLVWHFVLAPMTAFARTILHVSAWKMMFWYVPLLSGLIGSVWLVRFTSREIPWLNRMRWFATPQEIEPHFVVTGTLRLEPVMAARVPGHVRADDAVRDPWFALRHRRLCAERPAKYAFWQPRLEGRSFADLSDGEKRIVLSERRLYDLYHRDAWLADAQAGGSPEKD